MRVVVSFCQTLHQAFRGFRLLSMLVNNVKFNVLFFKLSTTKWSSVNKFSLLKKSTSNASPNVSLMPSALWTFAAHSCKSYVSGTLVGQDQQQGGGNVDSYMPDYGLFEASRIACPVLPQYHPKQLMELLNSGKIRWVKAILAHLVRYIA